MKFSPPLEKLILTSWISFLVPVCSAVSNDFQKRERKMLERSKNVNVTIRSSIPTFPTVAQLPDQEQGKA